MTSPHGDVRPLDLSVHVTTDQEDPDYFTAYFYLNEHCFWQDKERKANYHDLDASNKDNKAIDDYREIATKRLARQIENILFAFSKQELPDLPLALCLDCNVDTQEINEYYMLKNMVWELTGLSSDGFAKSGFLCIGCVEERIGRELTAQDFIKASVNSPEFFDQSERLQNRLSTHL